MPTEIKENKLQQRLEALTKEREALQTELASANARLFEMLRIAQDCLTSKTCPDYQTAFRHGMHTVLEELKKYMQSQGLDLPRNGWQCIKQEKANFTLSVLYARGKPVVAKVTGLHLPMYKLTNAIILQSINEYCADTPVKWASPNWEKDFGSLVRDLEPKDAV